MRRMKGGHFRPPTPEPSVPARVSAETSNAIRAEVAWAGPGAVMSAALLRRGLELLTESEGEEGFPGGARRGQGDGGGSRQKPRGEE